MNKRRRRRIRRNNRKKTIDIPDFEYLDYLAKMKWVSISWFRKRILGEL